MLSAGRVLDEKPNKKVYTITVVGRRELRRWLAAPLSILSHRNHLLVQLFFARHVGRAAVVANLKHYQKEIEKKEAFLNSPAVEYMLTLAEDPLELALFEIIRDNGRMALRSEREWVAQSVERLEVLKGD